MEETLSERSQSENATYYDANYMTFWKRRNYGDSKRISGCQVLRGGWAEYMKHRELLGQ